MNNYVDYRKLFKSYLLKVHKKIIVFFSSSDDINFLVTLYTAFISKLVLFPKKMEIGFSLCYLCMNKALEKGALCS